MEQVFLMHPTSIVGITKGQFDDIVFAYDTGIERIIALDGADLHLFTKHNGTKCLTVHTPYFSLAIFDYLLQVVCKDKKKRIIRIQPKNVHNNQTLTIYLNPSTV